MSLLTVIFVVLFLLSLTDFMFPKAEKLHRSMYKISFFAAYFICVIKYYYGPDIASYVPMYEATPTLWTFFTQGMPEDFGFEPGYNFFCSLMRTFGFSFWMMTAVICTFYFYVLHKWFEKIPEKKTFALFVLVLLDFNLLFFEFRQCLAVSFYLLMVLAIMNRRHLSALLFFATASVLHKSALPVALLTVMVMNVKNIRLSKRMFYFLGVIFFVFLLVPMHILANSALPVLPLPESVVESIQHHLLLGKRVQAIALVFFSAFLCAVYFYRRKQMDGSRQRMAWLVFTALAIILCLYQNFYILRRLYSYFVPIVIVYIFSEVQKKNGVHSILLRQLSVSLTYLYAGCVIPVLYFGEIHSSSHVNTICTIFSRLTKSKEQIKKEQLQKAEIFWDEYMQDDSNRVDKK